MLSVQPDSTGTLQGRTSCPTLFFACVLAVQPDSTGTLQGPYLQCTAVGQWEATVLAHRKANDDHIQLVQGHTKAGKPSHRCFLPICPGQSALCEGSNCQWSRMRRCINRCTQYAPEPQQYFVTQDDIRLALPSGPGGEDNYVLGLAVDFCADTVRALQGCVCVGVLCRHAGRFCVGVLCRIFAPLEVRTEHESVRAPPACAYAKAPVLSPYTWQMPLLLCHTRTRTHEHTHTHEDTHMSMSTHMSTEIHAHTHVSTSMLPGLPIHRAPSPTP
eukprot:1158414-Pelagomonas_calceolata.AAC.4